MWFNKKKCEMCGSKDTSTYMGYKILKSGSSKMSLKEAANFNIRETGFDLAFSDLTPKTPEGTVYFYRLDSDRHTTHELCSLKCAFDYCVKYDFLIFYPDNERQGYTRGLSPDILKINKVLGLPESNKYRGQPGVKIG